MQETLSIFERKENSSTKKDELAVQNSYEMGSGVDCNINNSMTRLANNKQEMFSQKLIPSVLSDSNLVNLQMTNRKPSVSESFQTSKNKTFKNTPETNSRTALKRQDKGIDSRTFDGNTKKMKNYKVINEMKEGDYFGEISVMTNHPATASIHTVALTVCCEIQKDHFLSFVNDFSDWKKKILDKIHTYSDQHFRDLHKIIRNVPYLGKLSYRSAREVILNTQKKMYNENSVI